jgi:hypothetical protein
VCRRKYGKSSSEEIREIYTIQFSSLSLPVEANEWILIQILNPDPGVVVIFRTWELTSHNLTE